MNPVEELVPDTHGMKRINNERRTKNSKLLKYRDIGRFLGK